MNILPKQAFEICHWEASLLSRLKHPPTNDSSG